MNDAVLQIVYAALEEANDDRLDLPPLPRRPGTRLYGTEEGLDSLGLVNFLVAVEERLESSLGALIALCDERTLAAEPSPLESVLALVEHVERLLEATPPRGGSA